jgi:hypothetical protein
MDTIKFGGVPNSPVAIPVANAILPQRLAILVDWRKFLMADEKPTQGAASRPTLAIWPQLACKELLKSRRLRKPWPSNRWPRCITRKPTRTDQRQSPAACIDSKKIESFRSLVREKITTGDISFRKDFSRSLTDTVETDDRVISIGGLQSTFEQPAIVGWQPGRVIRIFVRKWRTIQNKTSNWFG